MAEKKDIKKKKKISAGKVMAIGAGMAAVGAGAYYLLGPNGKKNQQKVKKIVKKVELEIKRKAKPAIKKSEKIVKKAIKDVKKIMK